MRGSHVGLLALALAVTLTSVAAAGPAGAKQRVAITVKGTAAKPNGARFVLAPLEAGVLKPDSGAVSAAALPPERVLMREGQRVAIYGPVVQTFKGKRGSLTIRLRIEYVEAGNGYHVGTGTWKAARGSGQYARIAGGGRLGTVYRDGSPGPWSGNAEGFLILP